MVLLILILLGLFCWYFWKQFTYNLPVVLTVIGIFLVLFLAIKYWWIFVLIIVGFLIYAYYTGEKEITNQQESDNEKEVVDSEVVE